MREHVIDFGRQHVITKDTVLTDIDALVYYQVTAKKKIQQTNFEQVTDAELAVYKIQNLPDAVELLTQTTVTLKNRFFFFRKKIFFFIAA